MSGRIHPVVGLTPGGGHAIWTRMERTVVRRRGKRMVYRQAVVTVHAWGPPRFVRVDEMPPVDVHEIGYVNAFALATPMPDRPVGHSTSCGSGYINFTTGRPYPCNCGVA